MKKVIFVGIFLIFGASGIFAKLPSNFNNQQLLINKLEVNLSLIKNLTQNVLDNPADTPQTRSDLVTCVYKKERLADETSEILCKEFLQKYILPQDAELSEKLALVHKMLNLCFLLKTTVDMNAVNNLETSFEEFKQQLKLNYQNDPDYKPSKRRRYRPSRKW